MKGPKRAAGGEWMMAEVIGSPIAHSKSPHIHRQWIKALNINACFDAAQVEPAELGHWLAGRRVGQTWRGCSVTAPLKQAAVPFVDQLSYEAKRLGAINLICNEGSKLKGHNSDLEGIRVALTPHVRYRNQVVIAGAGGAMLAALCYAIDEGFDDIRVIARDPGRVFDKLASRFSARFRMTPCERAHLAIKNADLIINATPMGSSYGAPMRHDILEALEGARPGAVVLDMVYDPVETGLLRAARNFGLVPVSGLAMLVGQARRAFELLFGYPPPSELLVPHLGLGVPFETQQD